MIRRHHDHRRLGVPVADQSRGQTDTRRRIPLARFPNDGLPGQLRELLGNLLHQALIRDHQHLIRRDQISQSAHGRLNHGLFTEKLQQLLGLSLPAFRPKTRPRSTCHDDRVKHLFLPPRISSRKKTTALGPTEIASTLSNRSHVGHSNPLLPVQIATLTPRKSARAPMALKHQTK